LAKEGWDSTRRTVVGSDKRTLKWQFFRFSILVKLIPPTQPLLLYLVALIEQSWTTLIALIEQSWTTLNFTPIYLLFHSDKAKVTNLYSFLGPGSLVWDFIHLISEHT
jgi:hypothetical protein